LTISMADSVSASGSEESTAQRQARLRREKRNAKIQGSGADRLNKITQLNGREAPPEELINPPQPSAADDPDEVEISEHHWTPQPRQNALQNQQQNPFGPMPGMMDGNTDPSADPMMTMMQQMLGGAGGMPGGLQGDADPSADPMMRMMQQMMGGNAQAKQESQRPFSNSAYIWRIVHAFFALGLAAYIALTTPFNGSKLARVQSAVAANSQGVFGSNFFYLFATAELILQSTRYFLEKGQLAGSGWLATIANSGMVPEPWAGYVKVAGRYAVIWQTIVADAMTVVFVLGCLAWWKGMATA